jgi:hypothetical protein
MVFHETVCVSGAGGKPFCSIGGPGSRLGFQGGPSITWAVAHVGTKARCREKGAWCAEAGPLLPRAARGFDLGGHTAVREER